MKKTKLALWLSITLLCLWPIWSGSSVFLSLFVAKNHKNCPAATAQNDKKFCSSFKKTSECYCTSSGLPQGMCQDVNTIYNRMLSVFGSVQNACEFQKDTSMQNCMDDWNCYLSGGKDSKNRLCSGTGKSCK